MKSPEPAASARAAVRPQCVVPVTLPATTKRARRALNRSSRFRCDRSCSGDPIPCRGRRQAIAARWSNAAPERGSTEHCLHRLPRPRGLARLLRPARSAHPPPRRAGLRRSALRHAHRHGADLHTEPLLHVHRIVAARGGGHRSGAARPGDDLHGGALPAGRVPDRAVRPADDPQRRALGGVRGADRDRPGGAGGRGGRVPGVAARRQRSLPAAGVVHAVPSPVWGGVRPRAAGTDRRAPLPSRRRRHAPRPGHPGVADPRHGRPHRPHPGRHRQLGAPGAHPGRVHDRARPGRGARQAHHLRLRSAHGTADAAARRDRAGPDHRRAVEQRPAAHPHRSLLERPQGIQHEQLGAGRSAAPVGVQPAGAGATLVLHAGALHPHLYKLAATAAFPAATTAGWRASRA